VGLLEIVLQDIYYIPKLKTTILYHGARNNLVNWIHYQVFFKDIIYASGVGTLTFKVLIRSLIFIFLRRA